MTSKPGSSGSAAHEEAGRGALTDRPRGALDLDHDLARLGLGAPDLALGAGDEALVVEPVEQRPVVLGEPHDGGTGARLEIGERRQLTVLRLLDGRVDGPAVWTTVGPAQPLGHPLDHVVA